MKHFKKIKISYEEVRDKYENFRARCSDKSLNKICCGYCLKCYSFKKIKLHKCKYI